MPVADASMPVEYEVTLQNLRTSRGARLNVWGEVLREVVQAVQRDVSAQLAPILHPDRNPRPIAVRPPVGAAARRETGFVSLPQFRWRVSARDAANNEGPPSEWMYFGCASRQEPVR